MAKFPSCCCLLAAAGLLAAGCSDDPAPNKEKNGFVSGDSDGKGGGDEQRQTAEGFAKEFLAAVAKGDADPATLTDAFKRLIAPPVLDVDKEKGFDESGARKWLRSVGQGGTFKIASSRGPAFRGDVTGLSGTSAFGLTVVGPREKGYRVAWFWPTPVKGDRTPWEGTDAVEAAAFAAGFLDVLLARGEPSLAIAERMMADPLKSRIGGQPTANDAAEGRGYNRGWLHLQLKGFATADSYRFTRAAKGEAGDETFAVDVGGTAMTVSVRRVDGEWKVSELSKA